MLTGQLTPNEPDEVSDGWRIGATYLTDKGKEVRILEICNWKSPTTGKDIKAVVVRSIEYNESAGYAINGDPLTSAAFELGPLSKRTSGMEKK